MSERWTTDGWRAKPVLQMPQYPDAKALADVEAQLATFPPLVFAGEARNLKKALARVATPASPSTLLTLSIEPTSNAAHWRSRGSRLPAFAHSLLYRC